MDDVLKNIRAEFLNEGVDEQVLNELQHVRICAVVHVSVSETHPCL